ncbi:MAG TPA: glycoside hydrolase family 2 protein, partial [Anaerolineales bacterium]
RSLVTFVPDKHLKLADPQLVIELSLEGRELVIDIQSRSLARFVELSLRGADVIFSDNYFDLPPNRETQVTCPLPEGWSLARAQESLQVRTLYHSYS